MTNFQKSTSNFKNLSPQLKFPFPRGEGRGGREVGRGRGRWVTNFQKSTSNFQT